MREKRRQNRHASQALKSVRSKLREWRCFSGFDAKPVLVYTETRGFLGGQANGTGPGSALLVALMEACGCKNT